MRIIFAASHRSYAQHKVLKEMGAVDRLLSYYEMQEGRYISLADFVMTGLSTKPKVEKEVKNDKGKKEKGKR